MTRQFLRFGLLFFWVAPYMVVSAQSQVIMRGYVFDGNRQPVVGVNLDFEDAATGIELSDSLITGDKTITNGFYQVILPAGIYFVSFKPPVSSRLVAKRLLVDLSTHQQLDTVFLPLGYFVTGTVTDSTGSPIFGVDLDFDRWPNKERIFTPGDNTDLAGFYSVVVPSGSYRVRFDSPLGTRFQGLQADTVRIARDTVLVAVLTTGLVLFGRVVDTTGQGIFNLSVDLEDSSGREVFLSNNNSDSSGNFRVITREGVFKLLLVPPRGNRLIPKEIKNFSIFADTNVVEVLRAGVLLSVAVKDSLGNPIPDCDLDVIREFPTRNELFTPTDNADQFGVIKVAVPPDSYQIVINPPAGATNFDTLILPGLVRILNDTTIDVILPGQPVRITPPGEGRILDAFPNPFRPAASPFIYFPIDLSSLPGNWKASLTIFTPSGEIIFKDEKQLSGGQMNGRELFWNGHNSDDEPAASGVYFCKVILQEAGGSKRMEKVLKAALIR